MYKIVLRSSEAIGVVLTHYFSGKKLSLTMTGELTIEQDTMEFATELFQLLLKENMVSPEHVVFVNTDMLSEDEPVVLVGGRNKDTAPAKVNGDSINCDTRTIKEKLFDYICEISPQKTTIKEMAEKFGLNYQSACTAIGKLR